MKRLIYPMGRALQLAGLAALPSSIWVGHIGHDEKGAIAIFFSSLLIFTVGYLMVQFSSRL